MRYPEKLEIFDSQLLKPAAVVLLVLVVFAASSGLASAQNPDPETQVEGREAVADSTADPVDPTLADAGEDGLGGEVADGRGGSDDGEAGGDSGDDEGGGEDGEGPGGGADGGGDDGADGGDDGDADGGDEGGDDGGDGGEDGAGGDGGEGREGDAAGNDEAEGGPARLWDAIWKLGEGLTEPQRAAVIAIAFLFAFLTVVAIWQIPPTQLRLTENKEATEEGGGGQHETTADSFFQSIAGTNFSRTVLGGLSGVVAVQFMSVIWEGDDSAQKQAQVYYLALFVLFFVLILAASALFRATTEALRGRVAAEYRPPLRQSEEAVASKEGHSARPLRRIGGWWAEHPGYWLKRFWSWFLSLRSSLLVFADTFFNVIQGRNQLKTASLGDRVLDYQWSLVGTVDSIAHELRRTLVLALRDEQKARHDPPEPLEEITRADVRVNISVLSNDGESVYYVSRMRGSLLSPFPKKSLAWVAVFAGQARWWKDTYQDRAAEILLFDNSRRKLPVDQDRLMLASYFQLRGVSDYEAFIVIPIPFNRRFSTVESRWGGIHISLGKREWLDFLWCNLDGGLPPPAQDAPGEGENSEGQPEGPFDVYEGARKILPHNPRREHDEDEIAIRNLTWHTALRQATETLAELLKGFNETVFQNHIRPRL